MYRTVAKRLLSQSFRCTRATTSLSKFNISPSTAPRFCTSSSPNLSFSSPQNPNQSQSTQFNDSSSHSSQKTSDEPPPRHRVATEYQEDQSRVLRASLRHVISQGWGEAAMVAGAREVGVSPSIVGSFPRKEAALVEFFMDDCLEILIDVIESNEDLQNLIPSECISRLVKTRLEMQAPYISRWAQALSIQAMPANVPTSFKQRAALVDEIWHAAGDESSDLDWYVKRTVLGGIYSTTEVYMLTDKSPDFQDTWACLSSRVRDAFDLKKTLQEAQYLAEAVGAGLGGSLQGLVKGFKR